MTDLPTRAAFTVSRSLLGRTADSPSDDIRFAEVLLVSLEYEERAAVHYSVGTSMSVALEACGFVRVSPGGCWFDDRWTFSRRTSGAGSLSPQAIRTTLSFAKRRATGFGVQRIEAFSNRSPHAAIPPLPWDSINRNDGSDNHQEPARVGCSTCLEPLVYFSPSWARTE